MIDGVKLSEFFILLNIFYTVFYGLSGDYICFASSLVFLLIFIFLRKAHKTSNTGESFLEWFR